jgi:hypothetical protein
MLTTDQIDFVATQLGRYVDVIPDYRTNPITKHYKDGGGGINTDITLLSYLCDLLIPVIEREHNLVNLISVRLKLIELKRAYQQDAQAEATRYADELLAVLAEDIDKLTPSTKDKALTLLTRYKLAKSLCQ